MISTHQLIEVRLFKWPSHLKSATFTRLLGKDRFGCWLGAARGEPWWSAAGLQRGVFIESLVKLVPNGAL